MSDDPRGPSTPLSVAVTGGIGAGKSTVSSALAARGAVVIDADRLAREVVEPGTDGLAAVAAEFGTQVLAGDGSLDRAALARIVFADPAARVRLEQITHPLVRQLFDRRSAAVPADGIVVNDIPLIRTLADAARYHLVIGVGIADEQVRVQRLVARGHTEQDARARIAAQISDDVRHALSDVWVDNSGDLQALEPAIGDIWDRLAAFASHRRTGSLGGHGACLGRAAPEDLGPDRTALVIARVARAGGGRVPELASAHGGSGAAAALTLTLTVEAAEVDRVRRALLEAGFPPVGERFGSADPGLSLDLYLTVKD